MATQKKRAKRTPPLLMHIWASAYGAAYVAHFDRLQHEQNLGFDGAMEHASAERAETIADQAVQEWVRWNHEGKA